MSEHNPDIQPPPVPHPNEAIQPKAADFVETPDVPPLSGEKEPLPYWIYLICGIALFIAGSSFTGFGIFGQGLMDQGLGGPTISTDNNAQAVVADDPMARGKKLYDNNCANCHQKSGDGQPGKYPPLGGSEWVIGSKERLAAIMLHGLSGSVTVKGASFSTDLMPAWNTTFNDTKISDIMTYIRASWGNTSNATKPEEVTAARAKFDSQKGAYNQADLLKIAPNGPDPSDKKP